MTTRSVAAPDMRGRGSQTLVEEEEPTRVVMALAQRGPARVGDGEGRNRTGDTTVFSRVLYQLSYLASANESSAGL